MSFQVQESCVDQPTSDAATYAAITSNIIDVEAAHAAASGPMSDRLMAEIYEAVREAVSLPWMAGQASDSTVIRHQDWTSPSNVTLADAWVELTEVTEGDFSWISAATASGATRMGFELKFRPGLPHFPTIYSAGSVAAKRSLELGWEPIDKGNAIFLPVTLDREALSEAFSKDNFAGALTPVTTAVEKVIASKDELDRLINLVRKRGGKTR